MPYLGPARWCVVSYALGLLAATLGRDDEAESHFARAAERHADIGAKWCLATTRLGWGEFLVGRGEVDRGLELLVLARDAGRADGYQHIERRAGRVLTRFEA